MPARAAGEVTVLAVHPDARRQGHGSRLLNASVDLLAEAGAESVTLWLLTDDESTRAFLAASGFAPDGAFRDRVVSPDGDTLREVRLTAEIGEDPAGVSEAASEAAGAAASDPPCPTPAAVRSSGRPGASASPAAPTASASAPSPSPPGSTSGRRSCSRC